ncbi:MAG: glutamate--tRNA ligase, partial [Chloroflexi bacterium]|nr:glutamate--tRNA ligase [Chloroflexota bacterium]
GGAFILRIEDTDVARTVPGAEEAILESLRWLGLDWDEGPQVGGPCGPYRQSERLDLYRAAAETLIERGAAYRCDCSPERLDAMREEQRRAHLPPKYDRHCRPPAPVLSRQSSVLSPRTQDSGPRTQDSSVVRFRIPDGGETTFHDLIRGDVTFANDLLDDFILLKSDGYPTYHLANVVDDHAMEVTHIMRADEWLPSTPRHVLLYRALEYEPPLFAHLPMILGPDRAKLSKRHGATALLAYRDAGYLPEALANFLVLLGWSLDDHTEVLSREEMTRHFSLERVGKTPAIFNQEKLLWMNGVYLRALSAGDLAARLVPWLERSASDGGLPDDAARPIDRPTLARIAPLILERIKLLPEAVPLVDFFFQERLEHDPALFVGRSAAPDVATARRVLEAAGDAVSSAQPFDPPTLQERLRALAGDAQEEGWGIKTGDFLGVVRVAVTGRKVTPPLFETMAILGRERCLSRIRGALRRLTAGAAPAQRP